MANTIAGIRRALRIFGAAGQATAEYVNKDRVRVFVNGEYFGLWDCVKSTFVD